MLRTSNDCLQVRSRHCNTLNLTDSNQPITAFHECPLSVRHYGNIKYLCVQIADSIQLKSANRITARPPDRHNCND